MMLFLKSPTRWPNGTSKWRREVSLERSELSRRDCAPEDHCYLRLYPCSVCLRTLSNKILTIVDVTVLNLNTHNFLLCMSKLDVFFFPPFEKQNYVWLGNKCTIFNNQTVLII